MSKIVEERVTEMRFDNSQFESNVRTSLSTIEKLKQSLNFSGASKGLENINSTSENISRGLGGALETVRNKFSALEIMGITTLANITNSAVNAGKRIISALTIDPIKTGFEEYETQINAIQTILANTESKGSTLSDVNAALDELNTYADKTIYNFTEMTRNIGTFTAAGVDLDTSVSAIKGIANLAAISGSNSQQASTAMYQLSQALAAGTVKLQDWNSVVNAGMGGQVFQDALKETARVHGVAIDQMITDEGSFRETLSKGWLTSEILTETLSKFTGDLNEEQLKTMGYTEEQIASIIKMGQTANDAATKVKTFSQLFDTLKEAAQSGWTKSWQIMIGDFEEAKVLLTSISDSVGGFINSMSDARNNVLQTWKDLGGRTALIDGVTNALRALGSVLKPIGQAFRDVFPAITGEQLNNLTERFKNITSQMIISEATAGRLKRTFSGLFSIVNIAKNLFVSLVKSMEPLYDIGKSVIDTFFSITSVIGQFITNVSDAIEQTDLFGYAFDTLKTIIQPVVDFIKKGLGSINEAFKDMDLGDSETSGMITFMEGLKSLIVPLGGIGNTIEWILDGLTSIIIGGTNGLKIAFGWLSSGIDKGVDATANALKPIGTMSDIIGNIFNGIASVIKYVSKKISEAFNWLSDGFSKILNNGDADNIFKLVNGGIFTGILLGLKKIIDGFADISKGGGGFIESITDSLDAVKDTLGAYQSQLKAATLIKIASAIAILSGSLLVLSMIDPERLTSALVAMGVVMTELYAFMFSFEKIADSKGFASMSKITIPMIGLATAILILSKAMLRLSELDWKQIAKGLTSIAGLSATMVASASVMSKSSGKITKSAIGLIVFAGAIRILVGAVDKLGQMDVNKLTNGLVGVGVLCSELALFLKVTNLDGISMLKGVGLISLATSILILGNAVEKIGNLDVDQLTKGLTSIGVILTEIAIFAKLTGNSKNVLSTASSMVILGAAMLILGSAIEKMGNLNMTQIGKGLLSMAGSLTVITMAMKLMPKNVVSKAASIVILSSGLLILSKALKSMGDMEWGQIGKSLVTLAGSLTILSIAVNSMNGALPGAAAILVISGALALLTPILKSLGSMSLSDIGKGLLALSGAFGVIGLSAFLLSPVIPMIALLAGSITLLGVGCLAAGAGILAFSTGITALAVSGMAGVAVIIETVKGLIALIPYFLQQIGQGIIAFGQVIMSSAGTIVSVIVTVIQSICTAITQTIPTIMETVMTVLSTMLKTIADNIYQFVDAGVKILIGFLNGVSDNLEDVIVAGTEVIVNFVKGIQESTNMVIDAAVDIMISFINGLAETIRTKTPEMIDAVNNLFDALKEAGLEILKNALRPYKQAGEDIVNSGFVKGAMEKFGDAKSAFGELVDGCVSAIKESVGNFIEAGGQLVGGLIEGIKGSIGGAIGWASELAGSVVSAAKNVFDIHSPSRVFFGIGRYVVQGLSNGIKKFSHLATSETESMGDDTTDAMIRALKNVDFDIDDPEHNPIIRPVLDMSSVKQGMNALGGLFKQKQLVTLAGVGPITDTNLGQIANSLSTSQNDDSGIIAAINDLKNSLNNKGGDQYNLGNITYDDGSNISNAVQSLVRAAKIERRI